MAMPRCSARASVSLKMPQFKAKGSGEAYQSWNSDHSSAPSASVAPAMPPAWRPPRSTSATSCSRSAVVVDGSVFIEFPQRVRVAGRRGAPGAPWSGIMVKQGPAAAPGRAAGRCGRLEHALFFEVLLGARVQRRGQAVLDHVLGLQVREG